MGFAYSLILPPTSIVTPCLLFQLTAPTTGSLQIARVELQQTVRLGNEIHRLAFVPMNTAATGTNPGGLNRLTPGAPAPGVTTMVAPINNDGVVGSIPLAYMGWNLVIGEKEKVATPDTRLPIPAGTTVALQLLTTPPTGGIDISGTLFFIYEPN